MTVSHTPGPWESSAPGTQAIHYRGQDVATVHCGNKAWKANARLIAAAPEMLEALIALLEDAEALAMQAKMPLLPGRVTKAHAAIAKATLP